MKLLYARLVLWLIQPALDFRAERRQRIVDQVKREFLSAPIRRRALLKKIADMRISRRGIQWLAGLPGPLIRRLRGRHSEEPVVLDASHLPFLGPWPVDKDARWYRDRCTEARDVASRRI